LRLADRSDQPVFKLQTTNAEAYELYLRGRFFWNQRGIGLRKALHYFELALIEDPDYALASEWPLGHLQSVELVRRPATCRRDSESHRPSEVGVQLDPQLAEAHTSLGFCQLCN
jgi:adenylate cyclase